MGMVEEKLRSDGYRIKASYCAPSHNFKKYMTYRDEKNRVKAEFQVDLYTDSGVPEDRIEEADVLFGQVYSENFKSGGFASVKDAFVSLWRK